LWLGASHIFCNKNRSNRCGRTFQTSRTWPFETELICSAVLQFRDGRNARKHRYFRRLCFVFGEKFKACEPVRCRLARMLRGRVPWTLLVGRTGGPLPDNRLLTVRPAAMSSSFRMTHSKHVVHCYVACLSYMLACSLCCTRYRPYIQKLRISVPEYSSRFYARVVLSGRPF
jgi:hypothetical protein